MKIGITSFDFEAAFKTLDSLDTPVAQKAEKKPLEERLKITDGADMLLEDYYNLSSQRDFEAAQERRELDIALAKLAKIEKIVDLDAKSPDEIQPSYVGKIIIQCPQCMTLFYKDLEDITVSEEDPTVVNVGEICQHCGNDSGYTQIGKVGGVEDGTTEAEAEGVAEDELAVEADVEEPVEEVSEEESAEVTDEATTEEALPSIDEIGEDTVEEEEVTESLDMQEALTANELGGLDIFKKYNLSGRDLAKIVAALKADLSKEDWKALDEAEVKDFVEMSGGVVPFILTYLITDDDKTTISREGLEVIIKSDDKAMQAVREFADKYKFFWDEEGNPPTVEISDELYFDTVFDLSLTEDWPTTAEELVDIYMGIQPLTEAVDIDDQMDAYNDYIDYLQVMIEQEEKALENAKNDLVKEAIKRRLDAFKLELENALPDAVTSEITVVDLPTPEVAEEAEDADPVENEDAAAEEVKEVEEVKVESLTESKEDCEEYEIASIEYDTDDFKYGDDSVMTGKVTVVCACGEEEFENDIEFTINSGEPTSLELIDAEEEFDEVELATVKALILDSFREEGILLTADENEREPLTEAPSLGRKLGANLKSFFKGGDPRVKIDSVFEKYKVYAYVHITLGGKTFDLNLFDRNNITNNVNTIIDKSPLDADKKIAYKNQWNNFYTNLGAAENYTYDKFIKAEERATSITEAARKKLPVEFGVTVDIIGGEKQSNDTDMVDAEVAIEDSATESFGVKATDTVRLVEADGSTATADYVLISSVSSKINTDVVGGLNNILNQQGGRFGKYTPRTTTSKADIDAFTTNSTTTSNTQADSTNTNITTDANAAPAGAEAAKGLTGGDVLTIAINWSLQSGGITATAGAFNYTSKGGVGVAEVLKGIKGLQLAAGNTPIEIKSVKSDDSIGTVENKVFTVSSTQAATIVKLFADKLSTMKPITIGNKKVTSAALSKALKSGKDLD